MNLLIAVRELTHRSIFKKKSRMNYTLHKNTIIKSVIIISFILCCLSIFYLKKFNKFNDEIGIKQFVQNDMDIIIVCGGQKFSEFAIVTVKSILFLRRKLSNLTFHIITDNNGKQLIRNSFNLSNSFCTKFLFYHIEQLVNIGENFLKRHQMSNTHYSGLYALSKAFISEILPLNLSNVILLDSDVIFVDDIYSIWQEFQLFKRNQTALGLVPWYPRVPPNYVYKGSGPDAFVTGVVLLDLSVCRSINLMKLFDQVVDKAYEQYGLRSLWSADQVILSLFATQYPEHFVTLPCYINGHTGHYLKDSPQWKQACNGEYPRNIHVVPSGLLLDDKYYLGGLYKFFKEMPIEWLNHCGRQHP